MAKSLPRSFFPILCAVSLVLAWRPLRELFSLAWGDDEHTYILLIIPIAATLIGMEWRSLRKYFAPDFAVGGILLGASLLAAGVVKWGTAALHPDEQLSLSILALVTWWIGAFVLCFGARVARSLMFPLGFLFLVVPLPQLMLGWIVSMLQQWSAFVAWLLFKGAGVPVSQDGIRLTIPGLTVEVATECSSIRSSMMLLVTTMVLAHLILISPWRKALVIAAAVPLSVAKNGLRIFTIAMLGTRVDRGYLTGRLHRSGGIVFFAISLAVVFFLLWILRRQENQAPLTA